MAAPPSWINDFADQASQLLNAIDLLGPVGCHYAFAENCWEITLFVSSTEVIGGKFDGRINSSRFTVNILEVCSLFSEVQEVIWQNEKIHMLDELGCHLEITGMVNEHLVSLRICSQIPGRFQHGRFAFSHNQTLKEEW